MKLKQVEALAVLAQLEINNMSKIDQTYFELCHRIFQEGKPYWNVNRQTTRLQIPSHTLRHSFADGFPAISVKKLYFKAVVAELIWFLRGDSNIEYLNKNGVDIWNKDAYNWYVKHGGSLSFDVFNKRGVGSVGKNYGVQWRNYNGKVDQISTLIKKAKENIMSNRLRVTAWNPSELDKTALPPCHTDFQIIGVPFQDSSFGFELHWSQRSTDAFLGLPFDIVTFALLAKIIETQTGYKAIAIEGSLKCVHFYENQIVSAKKLLKRNPYRHPNCEISVPGYVHNSIDDLFKEYAIGNFRLLNYYSYEAMPVKMLSPVV